MRLINRAQASAGGWLLIASLVGLVSLVSLASTASVVHAQPVPANVAVPFYTPPAFMQGVHQHWYKPRADEFAVQAAALPPAIEQLCSAPASAASASLQQARTRWQATVMAWDTLSAVAVGPLLQRRSLRQIDFAPTRPALILRAIDAAPADAKAMERIGTPAKGFSALEWLLWTQPSTSAMPGTPACRYAVQVALEIDAEAKGLASAFGELAARDWEADEQAAAPAMSEVVNQWVGGLERLRWAQMDKPLRSAGGKPPVFARAASGNTLQTWSAHWRGLRSLGVAQDTAFAQPGAGLVPLETYLRGRGLNPLATKLSNNAAQVTRQFQTLAPNETKRIAAATLSLASLKRLAEAELAPALDINIGFSDADGD